MIDPSDANMSPRSPTSRRSWPRRAVSTRPIRRCGTATAISCLWNGPEPLLVALAAQAREDVVAVGRDRPVRVGAGDVHQGDDGRAEALDLLDPLDVLVGVGRQAG